MADYYQQLSNGTRRTLFCAHTASGQGGIYREIAKYLMPEIGVTAFIAPGYRGNGETLLTLEEIAAVHVKSMRSAQSSGPYHIAGYSTGGILAFEIAQQLVGAGQEIGLLVLLDVTLFPERYRNADPQLCHERSFWIFFTSVIFNMNSGWIFGVDQNEIYDNDFVYTEANAFWDMDENAKLRFIHQHLAEQSRSPAWRHASLDELTEICRFMRTQRRAFQELYDPVPFPGCLTYIQAENTHIIEPMKLWPTLARDFRLLKTPGKHLNMMADSNAPALARVLKDCICG
jgi:thioesterase domain-containing protein